MFHSSSRRTIQRNKQSPGDKVAVIKHDDVGDYPQGRVRNILAVLEFPMWADTDTDVDFLNYSEIAELIAEMIGRPELLPLSLGVFGSWGVGKSSTLRLFANQLGKTENQYLVITFDAWLYQDFDDARAALMSVIASELVKASPPGMVE